MSARRPFGRLYAAAYDVLYGDKDYDAECDLLERLFTDAARRPVESVLDLGCGTGSHAIRLASRGYRVVGVDRSPHLLERARAKAQSSAVRATFENGDVLRLELHQSFDAVLFMFAVLSYQITDADVVAALESARRHLAPGGVVVADFWYGPAVLAQRPGRRRTEVSLAEGVTLVREASGELEAGNTCAVQYRLALYNDRDVVDEECEQHRVRYFFEAELAEFFTSAGLSSPAITAFGGAPRPADRTTWNALAVARRES